MAARPPELSYYELLEVSANATFEEIERSYRRIAGHLGPDAMAVYSILEPEEAEELRTKLDEAYRTLSDPERRAAYDGSRGREPRGREPSYPPLMVSEPEGASTTSDDSPYLRARATEARGERVAPPPRRDDGDSSAPAGAMGGSIDTARASLRGGGAKRRRLVPSVELTPDTEFSGGMLRRLRESADASLEEMAEITKVGKRYLQAIEANDFAALPAAVYVRGFVCEYARVLGVDPQRVAKSYMALYNRYRQQGG